MTCSTIVIYVTKAGSVVHTPLLKWKDYQNVHITLCIYCCQTFRNVSSLFRKGSTAEKFLENNMYMTKAITEIRGSASSRKHRMHFQKQSFVLFVGCAKCCLSLFRFNSRVFLFDTQYLPVFRKSPLMKSLKKRWTMYLPLNTCFNSKGCC